MKSYLTPLVIILISLCTFPILQAQELEVFTMTHISKTEKKIGGINSIMALRSLLEIVKDCNTSTKVEKLKPITYKGFDIKFTKPISLEIPEIGSKGLKEIALLRISISETSIETFNIMIQVQLNNGDIYFLGKYSRFTYAIICMIENPL